MAAHAVPGLAAEDVLVEAERAGQGVQVRGPPAGDVLVEAERAGEGVEVRARALIAAPRPLVWEGLTNYERLPSFIPGIAKSVVRSRNGAAVVVDQSGEATYLVFTFPIEVRLEVTESA